MQCLLTIAYALVTPFGGFVLLTGCSCAWQCTGDTGTTSYSSLSKAVLCFIKLCYRTLEEIELRARPAVGDRAVSHRRRGMAAAAACGAATCRGISLCPAVQPGGQRTAGAAAGAAGYRKGRWSVKYHSEQAYRKLGVNNKIEAIETARRMHLL